MSDYDEMFRSFIEKFHRLPPDRRAEVFRVLIGEASNNASLEQLSLLRDKLVELYGAKHECVQIVDGQLELRRLRGEAS